MAKDEIKAAKNVNVEYVVPVVSKAGETVGVFRGAELPKEGAEWRGEGPNNFAYTVTAASQEKVEVAPKEVDSSVTVAARAVPIDSALNPTVEGSAGEAFYVVKGGSNALRDPFQNITFSNEPKPSKLTPWVKTQFDAGLLVIAKEDDFADDEQRKLFKQRKSGQDSTAEFLKSRDPVALRDAKNPAAVADAETAAAAKFMSENPGANAADAKTAAAAEKAKADAEAGKNGNQGAK